MSELDQRPVKFSLEEDINLQNMEKILRWNDDQFKNIDNRRINQSVTLDSTATLADVISKVNEIITGLNGSDLTTD